MRKRRTGEALACIAFKQPISQAETETPFAADKPRLPAAADAATQFLEGNNASEGVIFAANLAIEEIVTNTESGRFRGASRSQGNSRERVQ